MKKKLEAELISIAHRILKLKNRAELEQLQQETLKLYEKLSVLKFVEDNFSDVKPTIGAASAEEKLEEIYNLEETPAVPAVEKEEKVPAKKTKAEKEKAEEPVEEVAAEAEPVDGLDETEEAAVEEEVEEEKQEGAVEESKKEETATEEPEHKIEIEKPAEEIKAMEESAAAVFEKEQDSNIEEEEKAADAEMITIEPDKDTKVEESDLAFDFAFERKAAPEEPKKEITFEDFHLEYKEPEFVKKTDVDSKPEPKKDEGLKPEYAIAQINDEPVQETKKEAPKEEIKEEPKAEPVKEEPKEEKVEAPKYEAQAVPKSINDSFGKVITLGLNDRIAFEKHLFGGSGEDLNRVVSQLNTINTFQEAKDFIDDLVKPDYNNWKGKEEYEERFMHLVEKKFD